MLSTAFETYLASEIRSLREAGLYKSERVLTSPDLMASVSQHA